MQSCDGSILGTAGVQQNGAVHSNGTSQAPTAVDCVPVLTRLSATHSHQSLAQQHLLTFQSELCFLMPGDVASGKRKI